MRSSIALVLVVSLSACAAPLGAGLLVHPETDPDGIGMVKYRVGGYDVAKNQMASICGFNRDIEILGKQIHDGVRVEESAAVVSAERAGATSSAAEVSTVTLKFRCVEREDGQRRPPRIIAAPATPESAPPPPAPAATAPEATAHE
jgi:hypothetical protein